MKSPEVAASVSRVLVVCTGNICRSPMAEVMLHRLLGVRAEVRSAGTHGASDERMPGVGVEVMEARSFDMRGHRSHHLTVADVEWADLVVTMERAQVMQVVAMLPSAFGRTFTLPELVDRAVGVGARTSDESLGRWLARVHEGRHASDLMGSRSAAHEVADPWGRNRSAYEHVAKEIHDLVHSLVPLAWPIGLGII